MAPGGLARLDVDARWMHRDGATHHEPLSSCKAGMPLKQNELSDSTQRQVPYALVVAAVRSASVHLSSAVMHARCTRHLALPLHRAACTTCVIRCVRMPMGAGPPKSSPAARGAARPAKGQGTDHAQASDGAASAVDATHGAAAVPRAGTICSAGSTQLAADAAGVRPGPVSAGDAAAVQAAVKSTSAQPEVASAAVAAAAVAAAADLAQPPAAEDLAGDLASAQPTAEAAAAVSHVSGEGVTEQAAAGAPAAEMPLSETVQPAAESAPRLAQPPAVRSEIEQLGALAGAGARMAAEDSTMVPGAPAASTTEACPAAESATAAEPAGATAAEPADDQPEAPAANKTAQPAVEQASGLPGTAAALETAQQAVEQAGELPGTAAALETEQQAVEKAGELPNTAAAAGPEGAQPEASAAAASGEVIEPPSNAAAPAEGAEVFNEGLLKTLEGLVAVKGKTDGDDAAQNAGGTTAA